MMSKQGNIFIDGFLYDTENTFDGALNAKPFDVVIKIFNGNNTEVLLCPCDFTFEEEIECENKKILRYENKPNGVTVEVHRQFISNGVVRCNSIIKNNSQREIRVSKLSSLCAGGIFGDISSRDRKKLKVCLVRSTWCGEGQVTCLDIDELHVARTTLRDARVSRKITSRGGYTSEDFLPVVYFIDEEMDKCWYASLEPQGWWEVDLGLLTAFDSEYQTVTASVVTGSERESGFYVDLPAGGEYSSPYTAFGCAVGGIEEGVKNLNGYKRALTEGVGGARLPVVFNDYLNCHWADPGEKTKLLVDKAAEVGAEVFCIDSGWYKKDNSDWFGLLGDWVYNDARFGEGGFQGILNYISQKDMKAGIWFEFEVCTSSAELFKKSDDWFLMLNGKRIFEYGRYFLDFRNPKVTDYIFETVKKYYDMGVRYIKNDYNGTFCGCESYKKHAVAGLEEHVLAVKAFYKRLRTELPDLMIENCSSGAMRSDYCLLSECDLQSISDLEEFDKYPAVISGSLLSLLPEQTGIWCVCYPQVYDVKDDENFANTAYKESMADGEQTAFNMVSGFMGAMYLSGRLEFADEKNLSLVKQAVECYKQYKDFVKGASPVYPLGFTNYSQKDGNVVLGLKNGDRVLLAVWHRGGETQVTIPAKQVKPIYPLNLQTNYQFSNGKLMVEFDKPYQARLFEIKI